MLRRARVRPETVRIRVRRQRRWSLRPSPWLLAASFAGLIAVGTFLLALPIASESRDWTSGWTSLFTATSAVSVTGLVRVDTAEHWSGFGEVVILGLIQMGGLGVTMYMGALVLIAGRRLGLSGRQFLGMELAGGGEWDTGRLLRRVMIFTVTLETVTFLLLLPWFIDHGDGANAVWRSFFHAISASNNAGFDVQGGLASFSGQVSSGVPPGGVGRVRVRGQFVVRDGVQSAVAAAAVVVGYEIRDDGDGGAAAPGDCFAHGGRGAARPSAVRSGCGGCVWPMDFSCRCSGRRGCRRSIWGSCATRQRRCSWC